MEFGQPILNFTWKRKCARGANKFWKKIKMTKNCLSSEIKSALKHDVLAQG